MKMRQKAEGRGQKSLFNMHLCKRIQHIINNDSPFYASKHRNTTILDSKFRTDYKKWCLHSVLGLLMIGFVGGFLSPVQAQLLEALSESLSSEPLVVTDTSSKQVVGSVHQRTDHYPELRQYVQMAIEQNPELQSMRAIVDADMERAREAGVLMDPEISVAYDFNPMMSDSYLGRFSISAMQMFPWFGTLEARRELQRTATDINQARISSRQLEILRDLQLSWFDIAEVREQIRITELTLELVRDLEKLVESRYETGRAGQADILRIQMEEQRLKNRIENLEDLLHPAKARFNELLNRDASAEVETHGEIQPFAMVLEDEEIRTFVRQNNPLFEGIDAERNNLEQQRRIAGLDGRPSFGIGVEVMGRDFGPMSMFPDANESFIGMATIRVPLFRTRYNSQIQQADHRIRSVDLREVQTDNQLMTELEQYLEEYRRSGRTATLLSDELVPRATQALTIMSEEYSVGNARFDELLQIQRDLLDLEFEHIESVITQNRAVIKIESLMGSSLIP